MSPVEKVGEGIGAVPLTLHYLKTATSQEAAIRSYITDAISNAIIAGRQFSDVAPKSIHVLLNSGKKWLPTDFSARVVYARAHDSIGSDLYPQDCFIDLPADSNGMVLSQTASSLSRILAHEYFHCLAHTGFPHASEHDGALWWEEGLATLFSAYANPGEFGLDKKIAEVGSKFADESRLKNMLDQRYGNSPFLAWLLDQSLLVTGKPLKSRVATILNGAVANLKGSPDHIRTEDVAEQAAALSKALTREDAIQFMEKYADGQLRDLTGISFGPPPERFLKSSLTLSEAPPVAVLLQMKPFKIVHQGVSVSANANIKGTVVVSTTDPEQAPIIRVRSADEGVWRYTVGGAAAYPVQCGEQKDFTVIGMSTETSTRTTELVFDLQSVESCENKTSTASDPDGRGDSGGASNGNGPANSKNSSGDSGSSGGAASSPPGPIASNSDGTGTPPPAKSTGDDDKSGGPSGSPPSKTPPDGGGPAPSDIPPLDVPPPGDLPPGGTTPGDANLPDGGTKLPDLPVQPAQGGGSGNGDPHYTTGSGAHFSSQHAGEFWMLDSERGMRIQVRQEPWLGSESVASISAVALAVGPNRVALYVLPRPVLRINGNQVDSQDGFQKFDLAGGGSVGAWSDRGRPQTVAAVWPDGSMARINSAGRWIDFRYLSAGSATTTNDYGLLGRPGRDPGDDLVDRSGGVVTERTDETMNRFINSWRIKPEESLFDYTPERPAGSFQNLDFPRKRANPDPKALADAEALCAGAGMTRGALLQACAFDIAMTGERALLDSHLGRQIHLSAIQGLRGQRRIPASVDLPVKSDAVFAPDLRRAELIQNGAMQEFSLPAARTRTFAVDVRSAQGLTAYPEPMGCVGDYDGIAAGWQWFDAQGRSRSPAKNTCADLNGDRVEPGRYYIVVRGAKAGDSPVRFHTYLND